jgi:hypothetical protein
MGPLLSRPDLPPALPRAKALARKRIQVCYSLPTTPARHPWTVQRHSCGGDTAWTHPAVFARLGPHKGSQCAEHARPGTRRTPASRSMPVANDDAGVAQRHHDPRDLLSRLLSWGSPVGGGRQCRPARPVTCGRIQPHRLRATQARLERWLLGPVRLADEVLESGWPHVPQVGDQAATEPRGPRPRPRRRRAGLSERHQRARGRDGGGFPALPRG